MTWRIQFTERSQKLFKKLDGNVQERISSFLALRVSPNPRRIGDPLTGDKKGLWRYRVGDYRVIVDIQDKDVLVLVVRVGHRREIYDK